MLPRLLARGTTLHGGEARLSQGEHPTDHPGEARTQSAMPHGSHSSPIQVPSPVKAPLPKVEGEVSMTMEVRELLSWAVLDMSGHMSVNSTPKRLNPAWLYSHLCTPQTGRSLQSSGHIIPGE